MMRPEVFFNVANNAFGFVAGALENRYRHILQSFRHGLGPVGRFPAAGVFFKQDKIGSWSLSSALVLNRSFAHAMGV
jgi:hypothetical protein